MKSECFATQRFLMGSEVFVSFLDILGFRAALQHYIENQNGTSNSGELIFSLWKNCLSSMRKKIESRNIDGTISNFVQISDSLVVYSNQPETLLELTCDAFGAALVWGIPVRGGLGFGKLFHIEENSKPGTSITLFGQGLVDAYEAEGRIKGIGMRLLASQEFQKRIEGTKQLCEFVKLDEITYEYPWWRYCDVNVAQFSERIEFWWSKKNVGKWFKGTHKADTEKVFEQALADLETRRH